MEGKKDPGAGRGADGETVVTSTPSSLAGATRGTPPAQRFANLGDAHSAITAGHRLASGDNNTVAPTDDSCEASDMPNSSSGFNPELATGGDANVDEPDETTVGRIVDQYLPSAPVATAESSTGIPDNATSSSGINPALTRSNPSTIRFVAASPRSDDQVDTLSQAFANSADREGAVTRFGFRENDSLSYSGTYLPSRDSVHRTPFALPGPPEARLPDLPEDFERTVFGCVDDPASLLQSTTSVTDSEDLLRSIRHDCQVELGAFADFNDDHNHEESARVSPLNLRVMNPDLEPPTSSSQSTEPDPFSDHPFGRTIDRTSNSGISGSDSHHHPFEYDEPPYRCFLRRSNELSVSQYLHSQTSDGVNADRFAHFSPDRTTSPHRAESHPSLPPLPPIPYLPMRDLPTIPRRATTSSAWETQPDVNQIRVPIHSIRGHCESRNAATYIREQNATHDDNYFPYPARASGSDGGDWVTELTSGGFNSNRAFASSDLQSPLERIGPRAGSSLANTSDVGYNDEFDLPMGARQGFSSNEHILPAASLTHLRGRSRGRTLIDAGCDVVFEARPRLHRINGYLQDSIRTFHGASPRDSGPFGAASRAFTSGLSSNPYMNLERSNRFDFHDEDSANFGNPRQTAAPSQAEREQETPKESRYAAINRDDSEQWTEIPLEGSAAADENRGRDYSIIHTGPQSPVYLECSLIERGEFARRQAFRRASGEEDQTFLDSAGRKLSNPSSVILRRRHQELQNPFENAESIRSQPVNANGTHSIEMDRLSRQARRNYPYPSQIQAGPLPKMVPIDERRRWYNQTGDLGSSRNSPLDLRSGVSTWAIMRHRNWFVLMLVGSMAIPFFWILIYTRIHGQALSWFTAGQAKEFTVNERMAIGICGFINLLVCIVITGVLVLMAHNGTLH